MPQSGLQAVVTTLEHKFGTDDLYDDFGGTSASLLEPVEQIRSAMSANGALIAVRDSDGIRCIASAGDAPPIGSRLQPDSTFTRQCIETGEVALCEDTEKDSRIHPSIAKSLSLRSAVAVPIQAHGAVIGIIEVFSSRPRDIYAADVAVLKQCANLFAHIIVPRPRPAGRSAVRASAFLSRSAEALAVSIEESDSSGFSSESPGFAEPSADLADEPFAPGSACSAVRSSFQRRQQVTAASRTFLQDLLAWAKFLRRFAGRTEAAQRWRTRAASVFLLTLLVFFSALLAWSGVFR